MLSKKLEIALIIALGILWCFKRYDQLFILQML